jgi:CRP-like cAMP-binding protein
MELPMTTRTRMSNMKPVGDSTAKSLNSPARHTLVGTTRTYPTSTVLFFQDSSALEVYYVERGLVKLSCLGEDGQELIVDLKTAGVFLGASSVILQKAHPVTAVTITSCSLTHISKDAFLHLTKTDNDMEIFFGTEKA